MFEVIKLICIYIFILFLLHILYNFLHNYLKKNYNIDLNNIKNIKNNNFNETYCKKKNIIIHDDNININHDILDLNNNNNNDYNIIDISNINVIENELNSFIKTLN